ncbi:hypothetical protein RND81_09G191000 [Saponaria officinalis]|uniref:Conserved oligomeric Golgi complex subunit 5 n=1 Tax=Saponaria officinalis TaxID=3572 RepID=A0AAW1INS2_SAPOF
MASPATMHHRSPLQKLPTFKDSSTTTAAAASSTTPPPHSPETTNNNPLSSFSSDPIFSLFLSPTFSSTEFSSRSLSSGSAASTAERLQHGIRLLAADLRSEVLSRHSDLLSQLSSLRHADTAISSVRSAVSSLQTTVSHLRSEISSPRAAVAADTRRLHRLHSTSELLQSTVRLLRLSRKLRVIMDGGENVDLTKSAQIHREAVAMAEEGGLGGIEIVDEELKWVLEAGSKIRAEGMKVLERGLEGFNQAEVGSGLQVFYNLGELRSTVEGLVAKYKGVGVKSIGAALDMKAISGGGGFGPGGVQRSGTPQLGSGGKAKDGLWLRMSGCMEELHSVVVAVWHLQRVLSKKRDPFTHVLLLDEVIQEGDLMLTDRVWEAFVKSFASQMKSAFSTSSFVKEIFTTGYPKLYSMIENLLERISRETDVKGVLPAVSSDGKDQMRASIGIFQTAFLALCLGRLSDLVNTVFPVSSRGSVPSKEHISRIVLRIQEEIEAVQFDEHLTLLVLREIGKVLLLLAERAEYQISTGHEARQITGPATAAQLKNFMLCQHLQEIHTRVSALVSGLSPQASEVLSPALGAIYGVACDSVELLFQSMLDRLQVCILQIHDQNFGVVGMDSAMDNNASPYMEELQKCILHFRSEFLSRLLPSSKTATPTGSESISTKLARGMASRVLMFFIRHASLVRPLSESGKLRMARDMAELELAVGQNLFPVEQLGPPYRALRAFRPVIFLDTAQLEASPLLQDLRPSTILHHLYSRGPDELQTPMQRNKLTPIQYSLWLDSQGEDQIWKGIKATLDDYESLVRSRSDKEFDPVYPIMLRIGSSVSGSSSSPERA